MSVVFFPFPFFRFSTFAYTAQCACWPLQQELRNVQRTSLKSRPERRFDMRRNQINRTRVRRQNERGVLMAGCPRELASTGFSSEMHTPRVASTRDSWLPGQTVWNLSCSAGPFATNMVFISARCHLPANFPGTSSMAAPCAHVGGNQTFGHLQQQAVQAFGCQIHLHCKWPCLLWSPNCLQVHGSTIKDHPRELRCTWRPPTTLRPGYQKPRVQPWFGARPQLHRLLLGQRQPLHCFLDRLFFVPVPEKGHRPG